MLHLLSLYKANSSSEKECQGILYCPTERKEDNVGFLGVPFPFIDSKDLRKLKEQFSVRMPRTKKNQYPNGTKWVHLVTIKIFKNDYFGCNLIPMESSKGGYFSTNFHLVTLVSIFFHYILGMHPNMLVL